MRMGARANEMQLVASLSFEQSKAFAPEQVGKVAAAAAPGAGDTAARGFAGQSLEHRETSRQQLQLTRGADVVRPADAALIIAWHALVRECQQLPQHD